MLGRQWQNEDDATKALYKRQADDLKKQHGSIYPNYQYQPRKPTEKKRRTNRRKVDSPYKQAEIQRNNNGNPVITMSGNDLDDAVFEDAYQKYNQSVLADNQNASIHGTAIFTNHTEEAQKDFTIYQSEIDAIINNSPTDMDIEAEFTRVFAGVDVLDEVWGKLSPKEQAIHWDAVQGNASQGNPVHFNTFFGI